MFTNKKDVQQWLELMNIEHYTIHENLTVDVDGTVDIAFQNLSQIPVQFGIIKGTFSCSDNKLKSLKGAPIEVYGSFDCSHNQITSLIHSPKFVSKNYNCSHNKIKTLKYTPKTISGNFYCNNNSLTSLRYTPKLVRVNYNCSNNKIENYDYLPIDVGGDFIYSIDNEIIIINDIELLNT